MDEGDLKYRLSWLKVSVPVMRALIQLSINSAIIATFYFGANSGINPGILSCTFSTSLIFTGIVFQIKYG